MANISHFTQTVNGVSTTYDIHDANAIPRSGGAVISGGSLSRTVDNSEFRIDGGTGWSNGASIALRGKDTSSAVGSVILHAQDANRNTDVTLNPNGTMTKVDGSTLKNFAMQEDVIPRSGGAVMTGDWIGNSSDTSSVSIYGGSGFNSGGVVQTIGAGNSNVGARGIVRLLPTIYGSGTDMTLYPNGTWTWSGQAVQLVSDQRYKQQIADIDDKLLDAWEDVELAQFKYNDAVETKGDKARLHTGYVVQQIQKACEEHGVDISNYGLFCHEEYPEETEEIEVEQTDGTKTKERKVIREENEHYSLRYTEALIVECKYLRRCVERLVARIEKLEGGKEVEK